MAEHFELTMQEQPRRNERLSSLADLCGETILATFDTHDTRDGQVVIVTDTFNWLVLSADADGCGEDPSICVPSFFYSGQEKTLAHFVTPRRLFDAGCINHEVYARLQAEEDEKDRNQRAARAARLRADLAKLEGGAA